VPKIEISYDLSVDGILMVTAKDLAGTGQQKQLQINQKQNRLSDEDIKRMIRESEQFKAEDDRVRDAQKTRNELESLLFGTKSQLEGENKFPLSDVDKKKVDAAVSEGLQWMEANRTATKDEYEQKKKAFESIIHPIMAKLYGHDGSAQSA